MFEPLFKELTFYLAYAIEAAAALIIAAASAVAVARAPQSAHIHRRSLERNRPRDGASGIGALAGAGIGV